LGKGREMWSRAKQLGIVPSERWGGVSFVWQDQFYVFGGENRTSVFNDMYRYCPAKERWEYVEYKNSEYDAIPCERFGAAGVVRGDRFYLVGGFDGTNYYCDLYELHLVTMKWRKLKLLKRTGVDLPPPRCSHGCGFLGNKLVVMGGANGYGLINNCFTVAVPGDTTSIAYIIHEFYDNNLRRRGLTATSNRGCDTIFLVGGFDGIKHRLDVQSLTSLSSEVHEIASQPAIMAGRRGHTTVWHNDLLYIFGGWDGEMYRNDVVCFDPEIKQFIVPDEDSSENSLTPFARIYHHAGVVHDKMIVFGGASTIMMNDLLIYNSAIEAEQAKVNSNSLLSDIQSLVGSEDMADIVLVCSDGERVPAHKVILGARSPYFRAMFRSNMIEVERKEVHLEEVRRPVLFALLNFIYGDRTDFDTSISVDLLRLADQYGVSSLIPHCEEVVINSLSVTTVLDVLRLCIHFPSIKAGCIDFIAQNFGQMMSLEEFSQLPEDLLKQVLRGISEKVQIGSQPLDYQ